MNFFAQWKVSFGTFVIALLVTWFYLMQRNLPFSPVSNRPLFHHFRASIHRMMVIGNIDKYGNFAIRESIASIVKIRIPSKVYPTGSHREHNFSWWRHQMETFSALLAICAGNSPVSGEFPAQRPVTRSFDVFLDVCLIKRLSKHSRGWWFETLSHPLWRHRNVSAYLIWMTDILNAICGQRTVSFGNINHVSSG